MEASKDKIDPRTLSILRPHLPFPPNRQKHALSVPQTRSAHRRSLSAHRTQPGRDALYGVLPELPPGTRVVSPVPFARPANPFTTPVSTPRLPIIQENQEMLVFPAPHIHAGVLGHDEEPAEVRRNWKEIPPATPAHVEFFSRVAYALWYQSHCMPENGMSTTVDEVYLHTPDAFHAFVHRVATLTRMPLPTLLLGLLYLAKISSWLLHSDDLGPQKSGLHLMEDNPAFVRAPGSELRAITTCLILANKFLDDVTYTNRTWTQVTGFTSRELSQMEMEALDIILLWKGNVTGTEWSEWIRGLERIWWCREVRGQHVVIQDGIDGEQQVNKVLSGPGLWKSCVDNPIRMPKGTRLLARDREQKKTSGRKRSWKEHSDENDYPSDGERKPDGDNVGALLMRSPLHNRKKLCYGWDDGGDDVRIIWMSQHRDSPNRKRRRDVSSREDGAEADTELEDASSRLGVGDGVLLPRGTRRRKIHREDGSSGPASRSSSPFIDDVDFPGRNVQQVVILPPERLGLADWVPKGYSLEELLSARITFVHGNETRETIVVAMEDRVQMEQRKTVQVRSRRMNGTDTFTETTEVDISFEQQRRVSATKMDTSTAYFGLPFVSPTVEVRQDLFKFRIGTESLVDATLVRSLPSSTIPSAPATPASLPSVRNVIFGSRDASTTLQRPIAARESLRAPHRGIVASGSPTPPPKSIHDRAKRKNYGSLGIFGQSASQVTMTHRQDSRTVKRRMGLMMSDDEDGTSSGGGGRNSKYSWKRTSFGRGISDSETVTEEDELGS